MLPNHCPTADKLEAFAKSAENDGKLAAHVAGCETCRSIVELLRDEQKLISQLKDASNARPCNAIRRQLHWISQKAVQDAAASEYDTFAG